MQLQRRVIQKLKRISRISWRTQMGKMSKPAARTMHHRLNRASTSQHWIEKNRTINQPEVPTATPSVTSVSVTSRVMCVVTSVWPQYATVAFWSERVTPLKVRLNFKLFYFCCSLREGRSIPNTLSRATLQSKNYLKIAQFCHDDCQVEFLSSA